MAPPSPAAPCIKPPQATRATASSHHKPCGTRHRAAASHAGHGIELPQATRATASSRRKLCGHFCTSVPGAGSVHTRPAVTCREDSSL